jgi:hypothetical protein
LSIVAAVPAPANAYSYGWVYIVVPKWWGWCPNPSYLNNYVTYVNYDVSGVSSGGDGGDDIVYAKVLLNQTNTVNLGVQCRWTMPQAATTRIVPTRTGQTFFVGATGGNYRQG